MNKETILSNISFIKECWLDYRDTEIENYEIFSYWKDHGSDVPKRYNSQEELLKDIKFIKGCKLGYDNEKKEILEFYKLWKKTSPDSFNYEIMESNTLDAANTLVKISRGKGQSNQWKGTHTEFVMVTPKKKYHLRPRKK
jgi:hypothetical protein